MPNRNTEYPGLGGTADGLMALGKIQMLAEVYSILYGQETPWLLQGTSLRPHWKHIQPERWKQWFQLVSPVHPTAMVSNSETATLPSSPSRSFSWAFSRCIEPDTLPVLRVLIWSSLNLHVWWSSVFREDIDAGRTLPGKLSQEILEAYLERALDPPEPETRYPWKELACTS